MFCPSNDLIIQIVYHQLVWKHQICICRNHIWSQIQENCRKVKAVENDNLPKGYHQIRPDSSVHQIANQSNTNLSVGEMKRERERVRQWAQFVDETRLRTLSLNNYARPMLSVGINNSKVRSWLLTYTKGEKIVVRINTHFEVVLEMKIDYRKCFICAAGNKEKYLTTCNILHIKTFKLLGYFVFFIYLG